ncbi:DNA topoisomerase I [Candidatus Thorarchaeota archaeon]|nr:MAG: DNA topoisomerase I [Candidatus Thorarchaeota archaeon]
MRPTTMDSLKHNGILVLQPPEEEELEIEVRGEAVVLDRKQQEMAVAWVKKQGTQYADDPVFIENFMADFSDALGFNPPLSLDEIDFSEVLHYVEEGRAAKEAMTKEEKKEAREARKAERERLKEKYGYAEVDGQRMELASYMTEPSGVFMGRGEHPLRGRWKQGATHEDITLNLSPDAPRPAGNWKEIVWKPECLWIAKWKDSLTGKNKYIWLHDSTPIKQEREAEKFDSALRLEKHIEDVREHIMRGLHSRDAKVREIAAACYLIDHLNLRVGDEKDKDEADTVGATTLRVEHLTFKNGSIVFDFLGKDSVPWHKELEMPDDVYKVFRELYENAKERVASFKARKSKKTKADPKKLAQIFPKVRSHDVNQFLSEVYPDLTAKMFRTYHASVTMREELKESGVSKKDPDFIKKAAAKRANLEVARIMNHTKQAPKSWSRRDKRFEERLKKVDKRIAKAEKALEDKKKRLRKRRKTERKRIKKKKELIEKQKGVVERRKEKLAEYREKRDSAKETWDNARAEKRAIRESRRKSKRTKKERLEEAQAKIDRTREWWDKWKERVRDYTETYRRSQEILEKKKQSLIDAREKADERIERRKEIVERAKERVKKAELAKKKIEVDWALARDSRTWNLGTSLKSYVHPKIVYNWCQKVDYDWRKIYTKLLQRKFDWVEG